MYPELQSDPSIDSETIREGSIAYESRNFKFNISKPANVMASYLYIFTRAYDCQAENCEDWIVKFNDNLMASGSHTDSLGLNPRGDGDGGTKQTIKFDVTNYVVNGSNKLYILGTTWQLGSEYYNIDGVVLVTFYQTTGEHEYWLYEGVEYLERNVVTEPSSYAESLSGATYKEGANGTLYTIYHNRDKSDTLYFNDQLLNDSSG